MECSPPHFVVVIVVVVAMSGFFFSFFFPVGNRTVARFPPSSSLCPPVASIASVRSPAQVNESS
jgi:hypothetical protein